ncbi:MAG: TlpA disulfide reductase family protein [Gammaproteobacteria bacterium]
MNAPTIPVAAGCRLMAVAVSVLVLAYVLAARADGQADAFRIVEPRRAVPGLRLEGIDGTVYDISRMGGKVVLVNFWATWCPPCVEELPSLQRLWDDMHPRGLEVLAVNAGEETGPVNAFLESFRPRLEFPLLLDRNGDAFSAWKLFGLPTTFVLDKQGRLAFYATGPRPMDSKRIRAQLHGLLEEDVSDQ